MKINKSYDFPQVEEHLKRNFSSPTHWPEWNLLVSKYYGSDFYYFIAVENNEIIGICPVHEEKKGLLRNLYSGQYHYIPYGGWLFSKKSEVKKLPLKFNQCITMHSFPQGNETMVKYKGKLHDIRHTLLIDLKKPMEEIWTNDINSKKRNMIRKAEKNNVNIEITENRIEEFYDLYSKFNLYKKLNNLPVDFFLNMNSFKNINIKYIFAVHKNQILQINVLLYDKNYAIHWISIGVTEKENLGQGEYALYETIKYSKQKVCRYFDLCYVEEDRLPNIHIFKKGFSRFGVDVPLIIQKSIAFRILNKIGK